MKIILLVVLLVTLFFQGYSSKYEPSSGCYGAKDNLLDNYYLLTSLVSLEIKCNIPVRI